MSSMSAFGIDHGYVSKSIALPGRPASALAGARSRGNTMGRAKGRLRKIKATAQVGAFKAAHLVADKQMQLGAALPRLHA